MMLLYMSNSELQQLIEANYGSIYKTSGGGKLSFKGTNVTSWVKKILGNRLFDLYVKYLGVTTLTTATLVPLSLILSKDYLESLIKGEQKGGFLAKNIPILDNELVGAYLKLAGLSVLDLSTNTLLPLGVVMIIYDLVLNNINSQVKDKKGGGRLLYGTSTPPNIVQKLNQYISANAMPEPLLHYSLANPDVNNQLQLSSNMPKAHNLTLDKINTPSVHQFVQNSKLVPFYSDLHRNHSPSSHTPKPNMDPNMAPDLLHPELYGMSHSELSTLTNDQPVKYHVPLTMAGGSKKKKQVGSGSDWMSSQYSAGPVNSPPMSESQFRAFNKSQCANQVFAEHYQKVPNLVLETPLSEQYHTEGGVSTSQYGSSLEPKELFQDVNVPYSVGSSKFSKKKKSNRRR